MPKDVEHKKQLAAEMVLDSEGLTDDLEDAAAKRLLAWGVAQAESVAARATDQDLDQSVSGIRRLIKRVNNLVADRAVLSDDELAAELNELVALAGETIGLHVQTLSQSLLADRDHLDDAGLVERIIALLTPTESDGGGINDMTKRSSRAKPASLGTVLLLALALCGLLALDWLGVIDLDLLNGGSGPAVEEPGGPWYQVYFTSPRYPDDDAHVGGLDARLTAAIEQAQRSVDVAAYELDLTTVADALIAAHRRGVQVRLVTDTDNVDERAVRNMKQAGIPVVDDDRGAIMHNKFVVIDGSAVWTGSWNLTDNCTYRNNNNAVALQSVRLAENYTAEFEEMFERGEFGADSPADTPHPRLKIGDVEVENFFAPEDNVADKLLPLLASAQSSIRFLAFSFTHDDIAKAMRERAQAGVTVQGVFEDRQTGDEYSEYDKLKQVNGIEVRLDGNPYIMHHKVIIIDDAIAVFGSYNFSASADEKNDENVLIVHSADFARHYLAEFQRVWAEAE